MASTLKGLGHTVSVNFPYYGGYLTARHADPARGIDSVFIEIDERLFIDINTFKRTDGFARTQASVEALVRRVVEGAGALREIART